MTNRAIVEIGRPRKRLKKYLHEAAIIPCAEFWSTALMVTIVANHFSLCCNFNTYGFVRNMTQGPDYRETTFSSAFRCFRNRFSSICKPVVT